MPGSNCRVRSTLKDRRAWLRLALHACVLPWLPACTGGSAAPLETRQLLVFGSRAELSLRGLDAARSRQVLAELSALFAALEADWHAWRASGLTRFNAACARTEPAPLPDSLVSVLERSQALCRASEGLFDPGIGGLIALWGYHASDYPLRTPPPRAEDIARWQSRAPSVLQVERLIDGRFRCSNPAVQLDFNAIAEGSALRHAARLLRTLEVRHALLNLGGDVLALGEAEGRRWRVGLRDPAGGVLGTLALDDGECLFSSGGYAKYRESDDGERWPHVLDPRSGSPVRHSLASAVLSRDPELADAAATALMVAGADGFARLVGRLGLRHALLLDAEDGLHLTPAMQARLRLLRFPARSLVHRPAPIAGAADPAAVLDGGSRSPVRNRP
jgi:FAD:protein FMN transferase